MKCFNTLTRSQARTLLASKTVVPARTFCTLAGTTKQANANKRDFSAKSKTGGLKKVLVPTRLSNVVVSVLEANDFKVVMDPDTPMDQLIDLHQDACAIVVRSEKITDEVLAKFPDLKLVVRAGAGYNTIDTKAARKRGVDVMNTPGANANAVAEEVIAMIMSGMRHIVPADVSTRAGLWEKKKFMGRELSGKTVGIVGLGNIGQLVIKRLRGFDCTILGYDPMMSESKATSLNVKLCSMQTIFSTCDVITLHIPETAETKKSINEDLLSKMKDQSMLINCARAGIIDEDALRKVKASSGKKLFFATDVYPKDEAGDKPVKDIADLMLPHIGANTEEANYNAASRAAVQVSDYFIKGIAEHVVNRAYPPSFEPGYQKLAFYVSEVALACLKGGKGQEETQPLMMETTFYGKLHQYSQYLVPPAIMGLAKDSDFDPSFGFEESKTYMEKMGMTFTVREPDDSKMFGESITIDLVSGKGSSYNKVSVRGTMTDGKPMISRINDFESVYFNPIGHNLLVEYQDTVGVVAAITQVLARYNVNVVDIRAPQDLVNGKSLCLVALDQKISQDTVQDIRILTRADRCTYFSLA